MPTVAGYRKNWGLISVMAGLAVFAIESAEATPIVVAEDLAVSASQRADETVEYAFRARGGMSFLIDLEQHNLDLVLSITHPDGSTTAYNSPLLRKANEYVLVPGTTAGVYRVAVYSDEYTGVVGGHSLQITAISPGDGARDAYRLVSEASARHLALASADTEFDSHEDRKNAWNDVTDLYLQGAAVASQAGAGRLQAYATHCAAMIQYWRAWDWDYAARLATVAGALYRNADEPALAVDADRLLAGVLLESAQCVGKGPATRRVIRTRLEYLSLSERFSCRRREMHTTSRK